jgi:SAM-dependent methyltransferase
MSEPSTGLYEYPAYYDVLFKRNYGAESDFLEECLRRHGAVKERSFLELGCGPARTGRELAKRGYRSIGLDLHASMLAYAQSEAQRDGIALECVQGNLIDFDLPKPVAMAACLWDTLLLVKTNEEMIRHLRAVARNLLPGGIYVIETTHPREFLLPYTGIPFYGRLGETEIEMTWGLPDDPYDCIQQQYLATIRTIARRNGEIIVHTEFRLTQRYYSVQELRALIALAGGFSEVHLYGTSTVPLVPLTDKPECNGLLAVMVKAA